MLYIFSSKSDTCLFVIILASLEFNFQTRKIFQLSSYLFIQQLKKNRIFMLYKAFESMLKSCSVLFVSMTRWNERNHRKILWILTYCLQVSLYTLPCFHTYCGAYFIRQMPIFIQYGQVLDAVTLVCFNGLSSIFDTE